MSQTVRIQNVQFTLMAVQFILIFFSVSYNGGCFVPRVHSHSCVCNFFFISLAIL